MMKKMSKFSGLKSGRNLRSSKNIDDVESVDKKEVTSKYFVAEILEPKTDNAKKRRSVEIKYDEVKREKKNPDDNNEKSDEKWAPANWEKTLDYIKEMRKYGTAPVDVMGCDSCADPTASASVGRYQTLLALMLSSQTKDQVTHAAVERLKAHGCTPQHLVDTPEDVLGKLIYPVGFWKRKAQYIKKTSEILIKDYNSDIPNTIEGLCALPGVGPKMAHICMQVAWNVTSGIGVDTHVHRICNRLGWVKKETKTPEKTRQELESWLPKNLWSEVNHLLVGFGQEICLPRFPQCKECLNRSICPWAKKNAKH
ncbi:endonuclease III-like protein 1 [Venturia canescens]|uniref:endonuclease III-like protein 1 n=1 Tax=Venturia canescens TaxID=32260 RepID=UPI001C9CCF69|nr:endonuclease III-like protein 1 [Venturia canescens]